MPEPEECHRCPRLERKLITARFHMARLLRAVQKVQAAEGKLHGAKKSLEHAELDVSVWFDEWSEGLTKTLDRSEKS